MRIVIYRMIKSTVQIRGPQIFIWLFLIYFWYTKCKMVFCFVLYFFFFPYTGIQLCSLDMCLWIFVFEFFFHRTINHRAHVNFCNAYGFILFLWLPLSLPPSNSQLFSTSNYKALTTPDTAWRSFIFNQNN